jgi:hypothetical protein
MVHSPVSHPDAPRVSMGPWTATGSPNHDEIRLWANHVTPGKMSANIYDGARAAGRADPWPGPSLPATASRTRSTATECPAPPSSYSSTHG